MAERAVIFMSKRSIKISDFHQTTKVKNLQGGSQNLKSNEIKIILEALRTHNYNQTAAEAIGISRDALIRRMKKYNIALTGKEI